MRYNLKHTNRLYNISMLGHSDDLWPSKSLTTNTLTVRLCHEPHNSALLSTASEEGIQKRGAFSFFGIIESSHFHIPFSQKKFCWDLYTFQSHNLDIPFLELTYTFHIRHLWVNDFPFGNGRICDRSNQQTRGKSRASWVQVSSKASRCTWVPLQAHSKKWASHDHRDQAKASSGRFLDFRYG